MIFQLRVGTWIFLILVLTWVQLDSQFGAKSVPRGLQSPSQHASYFRCLFLSIWGASLVEFWWVWGVSQKSIIWSIVGKLPDIAKMLTHFQFFNVFGSLGLPTSKHHKKKCFQVDQKLSTKNWWAYWSNFWCFWNQLGLILGGFRRPSWSQVGTKCHQHPTPKPIKKLLLFGRPPDWFWVDFGFNLAPKRGSKTFRPIWVFCIFSVLEHSWGCSGPKIAQDPPRTPTWSQKSR